MNSRTANDDPGDGLPGAGIKAMAPARYGSVKQEAPESPKLEKKQLLASVPTSSIDGEPILKRRNLSAMKTSPKKADKTFKVAKISMKKQRKPQDVNQIMRVREKTSEEIPTRATDSLANQEPSNALPALPPGSPYLKTNIVGTTSAKLSYLTSQVLKFYKDEKILIFYDVSHHPSFREM